MEEAVLKKALVSVLVTFYNQEKYVDRALESIISQKTNFGVKILVGDDGSTDNTREIVREWIDKYPNVIELYVMDRGSDVYISGFRASKNRLNLLKYVDTEYFCYLDGDDYYSFEEKLQKQVDILDDYRNKDCIACGHNIEVMNDEGWRQAMVPASYGEGKYLPKKYWGKMYFHTDTLLARSSIIKSFPVDLVENNFNDNLITFLFIQWGKIYYIPESWAVYYQTGDGIWTSNNEIVNAIRNIMLYDICNLIAPSMKRQTTRKFRGGWRSLLALRKKIDSKELSAYAQEAQEKGFKNTLDWINYNESSGFDRHRIIIKAFNICVLSIIKNKILDLKKKKHNK